VNLNTELRLTTTALDDQDVEMKDANFGTKHKPIDLDAGSAEKSLESSTQSKEVKMVEIEQKPQAEPRKRKSIVDCLKIWAPDMFSTCQLQHTLELPVE